MRERESGGERLRVLLLLLLLLLLLYVSVECSV